MILVDLTQTIISNCLVMKLSDPQLIKHTTFNTLLAYKKQFGPKYGNVVLAADSRKYWRREVFPAYKGQRKHQRNKSDLDWESIFSAINSIKEDIYQFFPYKILEVEGAEADDVIAVMVKYSQTHDLIKDGIFEEEPQPVMIVSTDNDFFQLHKYKNVKQWSNVQKKQVTTSSPKAFLLEHIATGDVGDNIPNIMTNDDWSYRRMKGESARQVPLKKAHLTEIVSNGISACANETEKANFQRNSLLIDFDYIPKDVEENIIKAYENYTGTGSKGKLMNYFMKNGFKQLFSQISDF